MNNTKFLNGIISTVLDLQSNKLSIKEFEGKIFKQIEDNGFRHEDDTYKKLKKFVEDEVHGGDFDQGNSLSDTMNVLKKWWNKNKRS